MVNLDIDSLRTETEPEQSVSCPSSRLASAVGNVYHRWLHPSSVRLWTAKFNRRPCFALPPV